MTPWQQRGVRLGRFLAWALNVPPRTYVIDTARFEPDGDWSLWFDIGGEG